MNQSLAGEHGIDPLAIDEMGSIAIIGMSGRFPACPDVDSFWHIVREGTSKISHFGRDELLRAGQPASLIDLPNYVAARGVLDDVSLFDAAFFGFSPEEAALCDPQLRLTLECAWESIELAGYAPEIMPGACGVFLSKAFSKYFYEIIRPNVYSVDRLDSMRVGILNEVDSAPTQVAYRLGLTGPALAVQSFCSSSLVAVHLAVQSLLNRDCDFALAGGVHIDLPQVRGYLFEENSFVSQDGSCKAFDVACSGTPFGNGVGIVLLRRLCDALEAKDPILAVIRGTAVNNDGRRKMGFHAPSPDGVAEAVKGALDFSGVSANEIGYVEGHGTGTRLGDAVEVDGLNRAFSGAASKRTCWLGSAKPLIGHTDRASGVVSLIKAVQVIRHGEIPPNPYFTAPNPDIPFDQGPFRVNVELCDWAVEPERRFAGVNAMGIGGTNAFAVVQGIASRPMLAETQGPHLIPISARSETACRAVAKRLAFWGRRNRTSFPLADVAHTLQMGRRAFQTRVAVVVKDWREALIWLDAVANGDIDVKEASAPLATGVPSTPSDGDIQTDLSQVAEQWCLGATVDWATFQGSASCRRLQLPTYPFERASHWFAQNNLDNGPDREKDPGNWTYVPVLKPTLHPVAATDQNSRMMFIGDIPEGLKQDLQGRNVRLVKAVEDVGGPLHAVYVLSRERITVTADGLADFLDRVLQDLSLIWEPNSSITQLTVVTWNGVHLPLLGMTPDPFHAAAISLIRTIDVETSGLSVRIVDADPPSLVSAITMEWRCDQPRYLVALWRQGRRYELCYDQLALPSADPAVVFKGKSVLITGAFGGLGRGLSLWLARQGVRRFALLGRHVDGAFVEELSVLAEDVIATSCDVADRSVLCEVSANLQTRWGSVDIAIHLAGVVRDGMVANRRDGIHRDVLRPKVQAMQPLLEITEALGCGVLVLFSSLATVIGNSGQSDYAAANAYMASFGTTSRRVRVLDWFPWKQIGYAAELMSKAGSAVDPAFAKLFESALEPESGFSVLARFLACDGLDRVAVSPVPLEHVAKILHQDTSSKGAASVSGRDYCDSAVAEVWASLLPKAPEDDGDTFFRLGGNSLSAVRMVNLLSEKFGTPLRPKLLFQYPGFAAFKEQVWRHLTMTMEGVGEQNKSDVFVGGVDAWQVEPFTLASGLQIAHRIEAETVHLHHEIFEDMMYLRHGITLSSDPIVFDVGANIGLFSLFVLEERPFAHVHAIEPAPELFELLCRNLKPFGDAATLHNVGVMKMEGEMVLSYLPNSPAYSSFAGVGAYEKDLLMHHILRESHRMSEPGLLDAAESIAAQRLQVQEVRCPVKPFGKIIRETGVSRIDLLKIDAQKVELEILQSIDETQWPIISQVVSEMHDQHGHLRKAVDLLERNGFHAVCDQVDDYKGTDVYMIYATKRERLTLSSSIA